MRISDWSSDVCSSDLRSVEAARGDTEAAEANADAVRVIVAADPTQAYADAASGAARLDVARRIVGLLGPQVQQTDRTSLMAGKRVSGRVTPGGRRLHKKNNNQTKSNSNQMRQY